MKIGSNLSPITKTWARQRVWCVRNTSCLYIILEALYINCCWTCKVQCAYPHHWHMELNDHYCYHNHYHYWCKQSTERWNWQVGSRQQQRWKASDLDTDIQSTTTQTQCADALSYAIIIKTSKQQDRRQESRIKLQPWDSRQGGNIGHPQPPIRDVQGQKFPACNHEAYTISIEGIAKRIKREQTIWDRAFGQLCLYTSSSGPLSSKRKKRIRTWAACRHRWPCRYSTWKI